MEIQTLGVAVYDLETTDTLPRGFVPEQDDEQAPHIAQFGGQRLLFFKSPDAPETIRHRVLEDLEFIVRLPRGVTMPAEASRVNGLTDEKLRTGPSLNLMTGRLRAFFRDSEVVSGHNIRDFDNVVLAAELRRLGIDPTTILPGHTIDTMRAGRDVCRIPFPTGDGFKRPTLAQLHQKLFGEGFKGAHAALNDGRATSRCLIEMVKRGDVNLPWELAKPH